MAGRESVKLGRRHENASTVMATPLFRTSVQSLKIVSELQVKSRMERDASLGFTKPLK